MHMKTIKRRGGKDTKLYGMMIIQGYCRIEVVEVAERNLVADRTIRTRYAIKP